MQIIIPSDENIWQTLVSAKDMTAVYSFISNIQQQQTVSDGLGVIMEMVTSALLEIFGPMKDYNFAHYEYFHNTESVINPYRHSDACRFSQHINIWI